MNRISLFLCLIVSLPTFAQQTIVKYLSGTDKDHTVPWDFYINTGSNSGKWSKISVPSNWEFEKFGSYNYFRDSINPEETGQYKYNFQVAKELHDKKVFIVFEGSMTDTEVKINGQSAGPIHQGGFYRFKYDITDLIKPSGNNLLEVRVSKRSANASINKAERTADFWQFGGIFRPVYLEFVPQTYIDRLAIDAKANGLLSVDVYAVNIKSTNTITAQVQKLNDEKVGAPFLLKTTNNQDKYTLGQQIQNIIPWNPEFPHLYNLVVSIKDTQGTIHQIKQRFGFRTMEFRPQDGIYVNGKRVIFRGVNRHSAWPQSGRTLSKEISLMDVKLIKEMNMNAVRMSHYPPDQHFLDVCDSLGLFVLDELTGWQAKYDTVVGRKLVKELVVRDVNHPSIVIWDNGNEGGWNTALDADYGLYDPQKRLVIHPWERFNGTDTKHYPDYNYVVNSTLYGNEVFFPTEFMHGNYDGGAATALDDYWSLMLKHPYFAGGFLWALVDEGVVRTDKDGEMDTAKDSAPDGVVGPYREKEGSFFAVKEIWSPVVIEQKHIAPTFDGRLGIENRYIYTNLNQCTFTWKLVSLPTPADKSINANTIITGKADMITLPPGEKGYLKLNLPNNWQQNNALYLTATDPHGKEIFTWSWALTPPGDLAQKLVPRQSSSSKIETTEQDQKLLVKVDGLVYYFDLKTGYLASVTSHGKSISLSNGPLLAGADLALKYIKHEEQNDKLIVTASYSGVKGWLNAKWTIKAGQAAKLEYQYSQRGEADFLGITFNYPEEKITGMRWLGRGPYHVWKNRLKGQQFGVWHKDYNNSITGESWQYPEFKGYHAELYWVTIENKESPFTVYTEDQHIFLQMLKPAVSKNARKTIQPALPEGDIGFLNGISAMGTRFQQPVVLGPQSQKNMQLNYAPITGTLWFDFR